MGSISLVSKLRQRLAGRTAWILAGLVALAGFAVISLSTAPAASANVTSGVGSGACLAPPPGSGGAAENCPEDTGTDLQAVIRTALNVLTWITGIAAIFVLIIAGFRYVVSGGSSSGVTGAKNMIIYALIGVVIALLAQVIVRFVIGNVEEAVETARTTCIVTEQNVADGVFCQPPAPADGTEGKTITCGDNATPRVGVACQWVVAEPDQ